MDARANSGGRVAASRASRILVPIPPGESCVQGTAVFSKSLEHSGHTSIKRALPSPVIGALLAAVVLLLPASSRAQIAIEEWVQRYHGPGTGNDTAYALGLDANGNIYVTGCSAVSGGAPDYATLKYSSAGVPLWTNRYNGPGNGADQAYALGLDASGNVFVTGVSYGTGGNPDYLTLKYSSAGVPLWTNRYDGPANSSDAAAAVAVDADGNVFVTGYSYNDGDRNPDYATVAYSNIGTPLWTNRYNGPGNDQDFANAVAVDAAGNVVVTGSSTGIGTYADYATIKYSNTGVALWTNRYDGPGHSDDRAYALAVDVSGNVFVTGLSYGNSGNSDYATIAYSSAGVPLWTNRYHGPGNDSDYACAVAVDANGNVVVTGQSYGGIATGFDYATIKYSNAGLPLWTNRYNGPANLDDEPVSRGLAVDAAGTVYVTGLSVGTGLNWDYATVAYSNAGVPLWTNRYAGPENLDDEAVGVVVDAGGNVYVTGTSQGVSGDWDYATIKYSVLRPIPLATQRVGNQLVLSWTNAAFRLQSGPALTGPFTNLAGATSPFTNSISGAQQFFRLISN